VVDDASTELGKAPTQASDQVSVGGDDSKAFNQTSVDEKENRMSKEENEHDP